MSSTLFVTTLPSDASEQDVTDWFRSKEGYVSARMRADRNKNKCAFVEFESVRDAENAKKDLEGKNGMKIDFSHNKPQAKRKRDDHVDGRDAKRARVDSPPRGRYESDGQFGRSARLEPLAAIPLPLIRDVRLDDRDGRRRVSREDLEKVSLCVKGVPHDSTLREVSHIFRMFTGFEEIRLMPERDASKDTQLCFVDFRTKIEAETAMNAMQNYPFDFREPERNKLMIAFARSRPRGGGRTAERGERGGERGSDRSDRRTTKRERSRSRSPRGEAGARRERSKSRSERPAAEEPRDREHRRDGRGGSEEREARSPSRQRSTKEDNEDSVVVEAAAEEKSEG